VAAKFETLWSLPPHVADPRNAVMQSFKSLQWGVTEQSNSSIAAAVGKSMESFGEKITVTLSTDRSVHVRSECRGFQFVDWGKNKANVYAFLAALEKVCLAPGSPTAATPDVAAITPAAEPAATDGAPSMNERHAAAEARRQRIMALLLISAAALVVANQGWRWMKKSSDASTGVSATTQGGNSESGRIPAETMTRIFDPSVDQTQREGLVRTVVAGKYHTLEVAGFFNYDLRVDGTYSQEGCLPFGEVSERRWQSYGNGEWTVREGRYGDSGKIYYGIHLSEEPEYIDAFIFDRDQGLVRWQGEAEGAADIARGNSSKCAFPNEN
jgi:hypothetical protein